MPTPWLSQSNIGPLVERILELIGSAGTHRLHANVVPYDRIAGLRFFDRSVATLIDAIAVLVNNADRSLLNPRIAIFISTEPHFSKSVPERAMA